MGRSGDPRKRHGTSGPPVEAVFWQPFRHTCGCYLEWGTEVPHADELHGAAAQKQMFQFLGAIKDYPCPMHGSASGVPAEPLPPGSRRYLAASGVWYKECPPERHVYADRLLAHLEQP